MTWSCNIAVFRNLLDRRPQRLTRSWSEMCRNLTTFRETAEKTECPLWSPVEYAPGARRGNAGVVSLSWLVLDYDDGRRLREARTTWKDWPHIIHTSYSHSSDHHKFRVCVPLESPVPAEAWPRVWRWAEERTGKAIDKHCKDPARMFYVPAHPPEGEHWAQVWDEPSRMLDLSDWRDLPEPESLVAARKRAVPRPPARMPPGVRPSAALREARERLKSDAGARHRAAMMLGAGIRGTSPDESAHGMVCPSCSRPSVWFPLSPHGTPQAMCNHRNSCGWSGWLDVLLEGAGISPEHSA